MARSQPLGNSFRQTQVDPCAAHAWASGLGFKLKQPPAVRGAERAGGLELLELGLLFLKAVPRGSLCPTVVFGDPSCTLVRAEPLGSEGQLPPGRAGHPPLTMVNPIGGSRRPGSCRLADLLPKWLSFIFMT